MDYFEAKELYNTLNGIETIPKNVMDIIINFENENFEKEQLGMTLESFKKLSKKQIDKITNNGYEIYEYLDNRDYTNYENLKKGDLVAVKFNGINYLTVNISKYIKLRSANKLQNATGCVINAHPPRHFFNRYKKSLI